MVASISCGGKVWMRDEAGSYRECGMCGVGLSYGVTEGWAEGGRTSVISRWEKGVEVSYALTEVRGIISCVVCVLKSSDVGSGRWVLVCVGGCSEGVPCVERGANYAMKGYDVLHEVVACCKDDFEGSGDGV